MFTKLVRIGRDAEMKYLPTGTAILEFSAVYDIGFGDNKKPQWIKVAMFGQRAEKLAAHFTKGKQIVATMDDVKSEAWISNGEAKGGLSAKLVEFEFAGGQAPQGGQQNQQRQAPQQQQQRQAPQQQAQQSWGNAPQQAPAPQQQQAPQMAPAYQAAPQQASTQAPAQYNEPNQSFDDNSPY